MDPNGIASSKTRDEYDINDQLSGFKITTIVRNDGSSTTYRHKAGQEPATGDVTATGRDEKIAKDWLDTQKFATGTGQKETAAALDEKQYQQTLEKYKTDLAKSQEGADLARSRLAEVIRIHDVQNAAQQGRLDETVRQNTEGNRLAGERLALAQDKNQFIQQSADAKAEALQEKNRLANLVAIGQLDVNNATKQFDNFTNLLGEITKGAQYSVAPGSEYFPGLGPGSTFEKFTGQPARTGGTYNPIDYALSKSGPIRSVPTVEEALAKASGLQKQYDTTPQTAAAVLPAVNPAMNPELDAAPSTASALDPAIQQMIAATSAKHGLDPALFNKLIQTESGFNPNAVSSAGAQGLGQIMPETGKGLGLENPFDPQQNLDASARYLKQLLSQFNYDPKLALAAYNAGPGAVQQYGGVPPFEETKRYLQLMGYGG